MKKKKNRGKVYWRTFFKLLKFYKNMEMGTMPVLIQSRVLDLYRRMFYSLSNSEIICHAYEIFTLPLS